MFKDGKRKRGVLRESRPGGPQINLKLQQEDLISPRNRRGGNNQDRKADAGSQTNALGLGLFGPPLSYMPANIGKKKPSPVRFLQALNPALRLILCICRVDAAVLNGSGLGSNV